jgi:hypothetical protein
VTRLRTLILAAEEITWKVRICEGPMLPLISYFSGVVQDLDEKTSVMTNAIFEGEDVSADVRVRAVLRECV